MIKSHFGHIEPAVEAISYASIKDNRLMRNQNYLNLPTGMGHTILMISPSRPATFNILENPFIRFFRSGYKIYTTDTRIRNRIGSKTIIINEPINFRNEFREAVTSTPIRFFAKSAMPEVLGRKLQFIDDLGEYHKIFFQNRYVKAPDYNCKTYINYLLNIIDSAEIDDYKETILYISLSEWSKIGCRIGITKDMLDNPMSIFLRTLLKSGYLMKEFVDRNCTFLLVNEDAHEYIKFKIPQNFLANNGAQELYRAIKRQMSKMVITPTITEKDEEDTDESITQNKPSLISGPTAAAACVVANEMKRKLTGNDSSPEENIFTTINEDSSVGETLDELMEEDHKKSNPEDELESSDITEDEEIKEVIDDTVAENPELLSEDISDAEKKAIIEENVKQKVFVSQFKPEKTKKQLEYIDVATGKQNQILRQSVDEMKSKIIDTIEVGNVISPINEDIKTIKYANADKSYAEKKYRPDINNAVAKMSEAGIKVFIEGIDEEDTSDEMNQKKTLTYHLVDENGKKHTLVFDIPIIFDGQYIFIGGSRKMILHQRLFKPIVKIRPDVVQIVTFYNKVQLDRHGNATDPRTTSLKKYISKNAMRYKAKFGNARARNIKFKTSLEFDDFARTFTEITIGKHRIIFDLPTAEEYYKEVTGRAKRFTDKVMPCIFTKGSDGKITPTELSTENPSAISEFIIGNMSTEVKNEINSVGAGSRFAFARAKILSSFIPVVLFLFFSEGFTKVMQKCGINYKILDNKRSVVKEYGEDYRNNHGIIEVADGVIVYDAYPYENSLLLNGLKGLPIKDYTIEELDSKDTYIDMLTLFYSSSNQAANLDKFRMFLIDKKTEEILKDFDMPCDLIEVFFYACKLLTSNQYLPDNDMHNMRLRSNEIISQIVYQYVVEAYSEFYKTANRKRPSKISMPRDAVLKALANSSLVDDASVVNPIYTLEKSKTCTIKASTSTKNITLTGINRVDGYGMDKRAYSKTMTGIFGLTTDFAANTGIVRELSLEPAVTSTNGYFDITPQEDIEELNTYNLFTAVELLTPPGVLHDDPQRSAMMRGQTSKMVMTDHSQPVLMGNRVESVIPYHLNGDFSFVAKEDGKVIDEKDGVYVVQYKNGKYDSFDTSERVLKNSSDGSYTRIQFTTRVKVGNTFKKNEVLAVEPTAMTLNRDDRGASCNIGVLAKVAVCSLYDVFEDSEPITTNLSKKLGFSAIEKKVVTLDAATYIEKMVKIGDHVDIGDPLVIFDSSRGDPEVQKYLENLRKGMADSGVVDALVQANNTTAKAPTTGEIANIVIYATVPTEQLSPTLQKIVKQYHTRVESKSKFLDKYKNQGDNKYYKCGQLFTETTEVVEAKYGKVKGQDVGEGVFIEFYIKHHDIVKKGDKMTKKA